MSSTASPITTRTSPMSGVFTPPSSCSSHWTYEGQAANSVTGGILIQNAGAGRNDESCYPSGFGGWGRAPSYIQIFSPGVCPSGYTTANNNYNGQTTTAVCCTSNFVYTNFVSSVNAGGKTAQYFGCTSMFTNPGPTTVFAEGDDDDGFTSSLDGIAGMFTTVSGLITMWAQPITVAFQQNDLSLFTTSQSSTSQSSTSSASSTISSARSATSSPGSAKPASSMPATATTSSSSAGRASYVSTRTLTDTSVKAATLATSVASSSNTAETSSGLSVLGPTISTTSSNQRQISSSGPSTGAIAGIVVGAAALLTIVIAISLFLRRQRRPTTSPRNLNLMDIQTAQNGKTGTGDSGHTLRDPSWDSNWKGPAELHEDELVELPNYRSSRHHELP